VAPTSVTVGGVPLVEKGGTLHPLAGYGAQFFTQLFGEADQPVGVTAPQLADLQTRITRLRPGHSRIPVRAAATTPGPAGQIEHDALMNTIDLAQKAGANVNLTWWHGPYFRNRDQPSEEGFLGRELMERFAGVVGEARTRGFDRVTQLTVQNEVNSHDIGRERSAPASMAIYDRLYRFLDEELRKRPDPKDPAKTLRESLDLVGGDLVAGGPEGIAGSDQVHWLRFMQQRMTDVLDGYSIHVYWTHGDYGKLEGRLTRLLDLVQELRIDKPLYVTEYGVRGADGTAEGRPFDPGTLHGENIEDSLESAFQHAWFNALAPQFGIAGLAKWACYRVDGDKRRPERDWGLMCGAAKQFSPTPTYFVTLLFGRLVGPGWKAAGLGRADEALVSVFSGPAGEQSVAALNRLDEMQTLQIEGLEPNGSFFGAVWNRGGKGAINNLKRLNADSSGIATVNVPASGFVALSTRALGLSPS
jgi:hypothetical protein